MRFSSISINLLKIFRIISFVFDLKYLSQNSINFNMLGVFWNPQDEQISKLSLDLYLEQHLKEILMFFPAAGAVCHHCTFFFASLVYYQFFAVYRMNKMVIVIDASLVTFQFNSWKQFQHQFSALVILRGINFFQGISSFAKFRFQISFVKYGKKIKKFQSFQNVTIILF